MPFLPLATEFQQRASDFVRDYYEYSRRLVPEIGSPEFMQFAAAQNQLAMALLRKRDRDVKFKVMASPNAGYDITTNTIIMPVWYYSLRALLKYTGVEELIDPEAISLILSNGSAFHESLHAIYTGTTIGDLQNATMNAVMLYEEGEYLLKQIRPVFIHVLNLLEDTFIEAPRPRDDEFIDQRSFLVMKNEILFNDAELEDSIVRFADTGDFIDLVNVLCHFKNVHHRNRLFEEYKDDNDVLQLIHHLAAIEKYGTTTIGSTGIDNRKIELYAEFMYSLASFAQLTDEERKPPAPPMITPELDEDLEDFEKSVGGMPPEESEESEEPSTSGEPEESEDETLSEPSDDDKESPPSDDGDDDSSDDSGSSEPEKLEGSESEESADAGDALEETEESDGKDGGDDIPVAPKPLDAELEVDEADKDLLEELEDIEKEIDELIALIEHLQKVEEESTNQKIADPFEKFKTIKVVDVMKTFGNDIAEPLPKSTLSYGFISMVRQMRNVNHTYGEAKTFGGKLVGQRINRIVIDNKIFANKVTNVETIGNPQIVLLVDWSGSMGDLGPKVLSEAKAIYEELRDLNIQSAVYAHTGALSEDGYGIGAPGLFHISSYRMHSTDSDINNRFLKMTTIPMSHNYDGLIISWLIDNAFVETSSSQSKILIVMSDGEPAGTGYHGTQALHHTVATIRRGRQLGVHILAFSLRKTVLVNNAAIYGRENHIDATVSVKSSFEKVFKNLQKVGF